jgi:hypothetical protein
MHTQTPQASQQYSLIVYFGFLSTSSIYTFFSQTSLASVFMSFISRQDNWDNDDRLGLPHYTPLPFTAQYHFKSSNLNTLQPCTKFLTETYRV